MANIINKDNFKELVLENDKVVLLDFWAPWCGPCRMLGPIIDEIYEENKDIFVGKVNVDDEPELASAFNVASIPTLAVIKNGKLVNISTGYRPKKDVLALIK